MVLHTYLPNTVHQITLRKMKLLFNRSSAEAWAIGSAFTDTHILWFQLFVFTTQFTRDGDPVCSNSWRLVVKKQQCFMNKLARLQHRVKRPIAVNHWYRVMNKGQRKV